MTGFIGVRIIITVDCNISHIELPLDDKSLSVLLLVLEPVSSL
jgi:hypothetical protein